GRLPRGSSRRWLVRPGGRRSLRVRARNRVAALLAHARRPRDLGRNDRLPRAASLDGMSDAVILMAYGSPERLADVPAYYADIRGGRPIAPEHLADLVERYRR